MNKPQIKVCGMREEQNILDLVKLNPDYIGFIFYPKSPRFIKQRIDPYLLNAMPKAIKKVGVFVNTSERIVNKTVAQYGLDIVQLHGNESPELCHLIRNNGVEVMKAFPIDESFQFHRIQAYQDFCDYFLFDTKTGNYGGSGEKFNWHMLTEINITKPVFLSGGIGPEDAEVILNMKGLNIHAIDINSRFEVSPGIKDIPLVAQFIQRIRTQ